LPEVEFKPIANRRQAKIIKPNIESAIIYPHHIAYYADQIRTRTTDALLQNTLCKSCNNMDGLISMSYGFGMPHGVSYPTCNSNYSPSICTKYRARHYQMICNFKAHLGIGYFYLY